MTIKTLLVGELATVCVTACGEAFAGVCDTCVTVCVTVRVVACGEMLAGVCGTVCVVLQCIL